MFRKLKESKFLSILTTISSWFWVVGTVAFTAVIFASTRAFTKDPSYSPGGAENAYLIPMLTSLFIGLAGFGLTVIGSLARLILRASKWPVWASATKSAILAIFVASVASAYAIGAIRGGVGFGGAYTGAEVFAAVNEHRQQLGLQTVKMDEQLCDNLVERWQAVKTGNQHQGFDEFIKTEHKGQTWKEFAEMYFIGPSPKAAIAFWEQSPGHKSVLEGTRWTSACSYANEGAAVMLFSYK